MQHDVCRWCLTPVKVPDKDYGKIAFCSVECAKHEWLFQKWQEAATTLRFVELGRDENGHLRKEE